MSIRTDTEQLERIMEMTMSHATEVTPDMRKAFKNIEGNLNIINTELGDNSIIHSDFTTVKKAMMSNQRQIRDLLTHVAAAALREWNHPNLDRMVYDNKSEIIKRVQTFIEEQGLSENEILTKVALTWIGITLVTTWAMVCMRVKNSKRCKDNAQLCRKGT